MSISITLDVTVHRTGRENVWSHYPSHVLSFLEFSSFLFSVSGTPLAVNWAPGRRGGNHNSLLKWHNQRPATSGKDRIGKYSKYLENYIPCKNVMTFSNSLNFTKCFLIDKTLSDQYRRGIDSGKGTIQQIFWKVAFLDEIILVKKIFWKYSQCLATSEKLLSVNIMTFLGETVWSVS